MTILIVGEDSRCMSVVGDALAAESYCVEVMNNGQAALAVASSANYEAIILDIGATGDAVLDACGSIREAGYDAPILILGDQGRMEHCAVGLSKGADDYLIKPFESDELVARMKVQVARRALEPDGQYIEAGALRLYPARQELVAGKSRVSLTPRECDILKLLMDNPGQLLDHATIVNMLLDMGKGRTSYNLISLYVGYIRRKLAAALPGGDRLIVTVRKQGYIFQYDLESG